MTTPKDDLEMRIEDFEHYYRNTFVVDNCGEFTRVRELTVELIKDREKMKAALLHYHEMYSGCFVTHHGNGEQSLCEVNQYDIGDVARKALGINS